MIPLCIIAFDQISVSLIKSGQVSHFPKRKKLSSTTTSIQGLAGWNWELEGWNHKVDFVEPEKMITGCIAQTKYGLFIHVKKIMIPLSERKFYEIP